jgi:hypothetical protein
MSLDAEFAEMDQVLHDEFGEVAIYNGRLKVQIIIDRNVERLNRYGELMAKHTEISFLKRELKKVHAKDTFEICSEVFTVDSDPLISDDGLVVVVSVS